MRGIKRCMPPKPDSRIAFLLVHYKLPRWLTRTRSITEKKALAAMSLGFFAMLLFHSYGKFYRENLTLVLRGGREISPAQFSTKTVLTLLVSNGVAGFYFTFNDKFHPGARAYFCQVGDLHRRLKPICPIKHLATVYQFTQEGRFSPETEITRDILAKNMKAATCIEKERQTASITNRRPYVLHCVWTRYRIRDYLE